MAWSDDVEPYSRPRSSTASILIAIVFGIGVGIGLLYYFKGGFLVNRADPNDPDAMPRMAEPRTDFDYEEAQAIRVFKGSKECVVNVDTIQSVRQLDMTVQQQQTGTGSGFIWDDSGRIVTNFHVIAPALRSQGNVRVVFPDRTAYDARLVGVAPDYDLAVLQVGAPKDKLKPIRIGTSKDLEVGQKVFAIGNPFGLSLTMTKGVISALDREIDSPGDKPISGAIQIDAPINPGNSGGPLLDKDGRLIGVNASIASPSGGNVGIGFAIPVDTVNTIVPELIRSGKVLRPDAGVKLVPPNILWQNGIRNGAMIAEVIPGGPAETAGLKGLVPRGAQRADPGDLVVAIDGEKIKNNVDFLRAIARKSIGDTIRLTIERDKKPLEIELTLRGI